MDTVAHFLNYALQKERKIVLIYMDEAGQVVRKNVFVTSLSDSEVHVRVGKKEKVLSREAVLGAGYARGDSGDLEKE